MLKKIALAVAALSLSATPAVAQTQDRRIQVENHSNSVYITSITIANEHGRSYQLLSPLHITPGYNRVISFDDGEGHGHCNFRATARFNNGTYAQRNINVCQVSYWRIYDIDNTVE